MGQMKPYATHFQTCRGLGAMTSCGRSLHGWSRNCPSKVTESVREVTCKKCLKVLEKGA